MNNLSFNLIVFYNLRQKMELSYPYLSYPYQFSP